ncbi:MAG: JAB domain-containing protein [Aureispira sp.]
MSALTASQLAQIPEIAVSFRFNTLPNQAHQEPPIINGSENAYQIFLHCWEKESLEYEERMYIMLLNASNQVLGVHHHATGGRMYVLTDIGQIFGIVLKANATGVLLAHNHPSGRMHPSEDDKMLTKKVAKAAALLKVKLYDHLIITPKAYFSFSDEGLL